jgi:hypothetical protein
VSIDWKESQEVVHVAGTENEDLQDKKKIMAQK